MTSQHEERLRLVGEVSCMRKMATFVSAAYAHGGSQTDQQYLSHMISGAVGSALISPEAWGDIAPEITHRAGTDRVISHRFSHLVTPSAKRLLNQERAIGNEIRKASATAASGPMAWVRKTMKKRTVSTGIRRVRRARK